MTRHVSATASPLSLAAVAKRPSTRKPMSDPTQPFAGGHHSPDDILAHPRFPAARTEFVEAVLGLYEGDAFLNRLLLEAARQITFNMIVSLYFGYDETDRDTWPTMQALKKQMTAFGLSSPRRIEDLVARLVQSGYLETLISQRDGRVRILTPTAKMISLDQDWLTALYRPLQVMFPDPGYSEVIDRDPVFQRTQRLVALGFSAHGSEILAGNPDIMLFMNRDAGMTILTKFVQMLDAAGGDAVEKLSYSDIGARFGVSRTHVRTMLQDAERAGLVALSGHGGRLVELKPAVLTAFDRFIADSMSGHDLLHRIALGHMTSAAG
jgi:DNA-binding MarR family transcriptional regulator